jgi:hypothetical protein
MAKNAIDGTNPSKPGHVSTQVSDRKLAANRENAKKSTGPRTERGKNHSRFNALRHGILSKLVMYGQDGKLIEPELNQLMERILDQYGRDDVTTQILAEQIAVELWRDRRALTSEMKYYAYTEKRGEWVSYSPTSYLPLIQRYATSSRRSIERALAMLNRGQEKRARKSSEVEVQETEEGQERRDVDLLQAEDEVAADEVPSATATARTETGASQIPQHVQAAEGMPGAADANSFAQGAEPACDAPKPVASVTESGDNSEAELAAG